MPLFEYKCDCGKKIEVLKQFASAKKTERCSCGSQMTRLMSTPAIRVFDPSSFDGDTRRRICGVESH